MSAASERARGAALAAGVGVLVLHALAGRGHAFGSATDEAYLVRLALALRGGVYALPGPFGGPVTDPLPGYPALIAPVVAALAPRWRALWILGLAATLATAWLSWRLARRLLEPGSAAAAGLLVALSPALVAQAGSVLPDAAFSALAVGGFLVLDGERGGRGSFAALAVLGGFGALVRPYGALLAASLALGWAMRRGARSGAALLAVALAPLAACLARNEVAAGLATGYALRWSRQAASAGLGGLAAHALSSAAAVLGRGALGLPSALPDVPAAAAGAAFALSAALGARRLARGAHRPVVVALAAFSAGTLAVYLSWRFAAPRYALPLLAPLWILAAAAVAKSRAPLRRVGAAAALGLGALALTADAGLARDGFSPPPPVLSRTADWARAHLPADARLESFACQPLELLSGLPVECASSWDPREAWLVHLETARIGWVHELPQWRPDGYMPAGMSEFVDQSQVWLRDPADFEPVFEDPIEGRIFRLKPRDAAVDAAAWTAFLDARAALDAGDAASGRARLRDAVRLRPRFAYAWALLAALEPDPARAAALLRRAAAGDPGALRVRAALAGLPPPSTRAAR
jgi:hypothetical protein